jgi:hypothetical protein
MDASYRTEREQGNGGVSAMIRSGSNMENTLDPRRSPPGGQPGGPRGPAAPPRAPAVVPVCCCHHLRRRRWPRSSLPSPLSSSHHNTDGRLWSPPAGPSPALACAGNIPAPPGVPPSPTSSLRLHRPQPKSRSRSRAVAARRVCGPCGAPPLLPPSATAAPSHRWPALHHWAPPRSRPLRRSHGHLLPSSSSSVTVVWTSLGPLPRWVPGPTTRWAPGTTRLVQHDT